MAASADVATLIEPRVPRAGAGDSLWRYAQRTRADLDGDGALETAVLISDVRLDERGRPMWEDGHRWQVYVEEDGGAERTYVYARFLPNGALTADLTRADTTRPPRLLLLERSPFAIGMYEIAYAAPGRAVVEAQLVRPITARLTGSPRP